LKIIKIKLIIKKNLNQIPATKLPREILFKSDNEEIEAFVCRDAQDEEAKTSGTTATSTFKSPLLDGDHATTSNDEIVKYLDNESSPYGKFTSAHFEMKHDSPKAMTKRSPLDLSPENFFMTSNEMNGEQIFLNSFISQKNWKCFTNLNTHKI
jgi:hypothetical protein